MAMKAIKPRVKKGTAGTVPFFLNNYFFIFSSINSLFSKHWLIRHRYRSGMRRMLDADLLA